MKSMPLCLLLFALSVISAYSQNTQDSIVVDESFFGNSYYQSWTEISKSQVYNLLESNPGSRELAEKSGTQKTWSAITFLGGFVLTGATAYNAWQDINNYGYIKDKSVPYLAASAVFVNLIGVILLTDGNMNFRRAINKFNKSALHSENFDKGCINLYLVCNRIGLSYQF